PPHITPYFPLTHTSPPAPHTLSLHDALPISLEDRDDPREHETRRSAEEDHPGDGCVGIRVSGPFGPQLEGHRLLVDEGDDDDARDRKSTRLNSSHVSISYAVFCLKKKKK